MILQAYDFYQLNKKLSASIRGSDQWEYSKWCKTYQTYFKKRVYGLTTPLITFVVV